LKRPILRGFVRFERLDVLLAVLLVADGPRPLFVWLSLIPKALNISLAYPPLALLLSGPFIAGVPPSAHSTQLVARDAVGRLRLVGWKTD
jgi:hypothetical protein